MYATGQLYVYRTIVRLSQLQPFTSPTSANHWLASHALNKSNLHLIPSTCLASMPLVSCKLCFSRIMQFFKRSPLLKSFSLIVFLSVHRRCDIFHFLQRMISLTIHVDWSQSRFLFVPQSQSSWLDYIHVHTNASSNMLWFSHKKWDQKDVVMFLSVRPCLAEKL